VNQDYLHSKINVGQTLIFQIIRKRPGCEDKHGGSF